MAYRGFYVHDVAEEEDWSKEDVTYYYSQIIYVDFDTEDEAYEFGSLVSHSDIIANEIKRLAEIACGKE